MNGLRRQSKKIRCRRSSRALDRLVEERTKELREELELKSRFVATVSHQYRTPLTAIATGIDLLIHPRVSEEKKTQQVEKIKESVRQMVRLLDEVLLLENSSNCFQSDSINLKDFTNNVVRVTGQSFENKAFEVYCSSEHSINFDTGKLMAILENLLSNAAKYSGQGQVVTLRIQQLTNYWLFEIQDYGLGIPLEDQPAIFEPFRRGKNARDIPGSGLGLTIVKRIVEACGGQISFKSEVGVGTTFAVMLPLGKER